MRVPEPEEREALARFQRELLLHLRGSNSADPWWREQLIDPVSSELLDFLQGAMHRSLLARLATYFPRFVRHARFDAGQLHDRIRVAVVCSPPERRLEAFFGAALELAAGFEQPRAWADLLRLERADQLWRSEPPATAVALVTALRDAEPPRFDARGVDDRAGFGFIRLDTTMVDLWAVPERSPSEAMEWGPPRQALTYWSISRQALRVVCFESVRELAIRLALES